MHSPLISSLLTGYTIETSLMPTISLPLSSSSIDHLLSLLATGVATSTSRYHFCTFFAGTTCHQQLQVSLLYFF